MSTTKGDAEYALAEIVKSLIGGTITESISTPDDDENGFEDDEYGYGFRVKNDNKTFLCWVDCDPEGNGPGFLNVREEK